jgi:hypothetical protein
MMAVRQAIYFAADRKQAHHMLRHGHAAPDLAAGTGAVR